MTTQCVVRAAEGPSIVMRDRTCVCDRKKTERHIGRSLRGVTNLIE